MTIAEMNERKRELGYTDARIAELSGVPLSTVRKVLSGTTKSPRYDTVNALTKVLQKQPAHTKVLESAPAYRARKQGEYTLADYLALPDDRRVELIDGIIYDIDSPLGHHQIITGQIYADLLAYISKKGGPCIPFVAPIDVQLDCDDKTIVQPDVLVLCDRSKYTPQRIVGAPDFIIEVLSKSTRTKDMYIKLAKYKDAGVREYWLVDPDRRTILVYFFANEDSVALHSFRDKVPVGIFAGDCVINFAPIDDFVSQLPH